MHRTIAFTLAVLVTSHLCGANPVPGFHGHNTHFRIHVPYDVHTVHHHHVKTVPIIKHVPIFKEVPVIKEVPIIKTLPVVHTVPVPVYNTVHVEKPVFLPVHVKEHHSLSSWH